MDMKKTPLYNEHVRLGGKMIEFGGWIMPVQYTNVIDEHNTVRNKVGIFDISHMGEFNIKGKDATPFLQKVCTNDLNKIEPGKCMYSVMCNEDGGTVDDLFIYKFSDVSYMLVVNAANTEKDLAWLKAHAEKFDVTVEDISDETAKIDIQGRKAQEVLQKFVDEDLDELERFHFIETHIEDVRFVISRTGYTGEDGFELYFNHHFAEKFWQMLLEFGKLHGIKPVGLGARDTLRLESCYSLNGHELTEDISPIEAGVGFVVDKDKSFIGSEAIAKEREEGAKRKLAAIEMIDRAVPRNGYKVEREGNEIGYITSGTMSPGTKKGIALALVKKEESKVDDEVDIIIRDKIYKAKVVAKPFYRYRGGEDGES